MPSYLSGLLYFIIGCFVPKLAPNIGQNAHCTICKSVAFIAMGVTEKCAYWYNICFSARTNNLDDFYIVD